MSYVIQPKIATLFEIDSKNLDSFNKKYKMIQSVVVFVLITIMSLSRKMGNIQGNSIQ